MANSPSFLAMRRRNANDILQITRVKPGISRAELAKEAGLAKATVSVIVEELLKKQVLVEVGIKPSSGGRPGMGLRFNELIGLAVGISLDKTELAVCLLDLNGKQLKESRLSLPAWTGVAASDFVIASVEKALVEMGAIRERILAFGAAIPSRLAMAAGRQVTMVEEEYGIALRIIQEYFDCQLLLDSNTNMSAVAEMTLSDISEFDLVLAMRLGYLVRTAVVVNGQVLNGNQGLAGELGHMYLPEALCLCSCGRVGCLNTVAGIDGMLDRYNQMEDCAPVSDFNALVERAKLGNEKARSVFVEAGKAAAYGLGAAINMLAPNTVILSGPALVAQELILGPMMETLHRVVVMETFNNCRFVVGSTSYKAEGYGAGLNALRKLTSPYCQI